MLKYEYLLGIFLGLLLIGIASAYAPPTYNSINISLCSAYVKPTYNSINITLGVTDSCSSANSCTYSGSGNWIIQCSDFCNISSNNNLKGNNVTINGTGIITITGNITNFTNSFVSSNSVAMCTIGRYNGGVF